MMTEEEYQQQLTDLYDEYQRKCIDEDELESLKQQLEEEYQLNKTAQTFNNMKTIKQSLTKTSVDTNKIVDTREDANPNPPAAHTQTDGEPKHTPTPWVITRESNSIGYQIRADIYGCLEQVAHIYPMSNKEGMTYAQAKANAAFICRAVNCHEELVRSISKAIKSLDKILNSETIEISSEAGDIILEQVEALEAVLAKAKGGSV